MKLTLISIYYNGQRLSRFVNAKMVDNKAQVSSSYINQMLAEIGCVSRGLTYSIG